jgi:MFS family permease
MAPDARRVAATTLVVLTSILLAAATLAGYARRALFDSDQFADRATATLSDPSVRSLIGDEVTDRVVLSNQQDLLAARPIIASAISEIVGGGAFRGLFHRAALDVHRAVFDHDENTVTLTVADVGTVVGAALQSLRPGLAREVQDSGQIVVVRRRIGGTTGELARVANDVRVVAWVLAGLTLLCAIGAIALSLDRRRTIVQLGIGMITVGVLIVVVYTIARAIVLDELPDPDDRAAAAAVWSSFLGDLRTFAFVLAGSGAVVAAAASSLVRPIEIEGAVARVWRMARTEPTRTWTRVVRALVLIAVGVLVIAKPLAVVQVLATLIGVYLVYVGVEAILRMIYRPPEPEAEVPRRHRVRRVAVPVIAVLLVAGAVSAFVLGGGASAPAATIAGGCDGHEELCGRPLTDVVLPATHNSMSAPLPGWFSAEQDRSIAGQLQDGIRGLLLDTHYADKLPNGRVRTYFSSPADIALIKDQDGVSQASFDAAMRLRERLGFRGEGTRGMYLCHTFCELGSTPLSTGLKEIHDFLVTHPAEVVVVVNQDYVTPQDFVKAIGDADLTPYAFTPPTGDDWPTLREMIDSGHRLVLLAENHAGAAPWYQLAYKRLVEETPFTFGSASLLTGESHLAASCEPNRGPEGAPLFLINHWVSTDPVPKPTDASKVNAYAPLLARARECERIRHHLPNLLAVNFYKRGDVFRVADTLNGVR